MSKNICPSCGTVNRPGAKFCLQCRQSLTPSPEAANNKSANDDLLRSILEAGKNVGETLIDGAAELLGIKGQGTRPLHPQSLGQGLLMPTEVYNQTGNLGNHAFYFTAQDSRGQPVLVHQVTPFDCDKKTAERLANMSKELDYVQEIKDMVYYQGRLYLILAHPETEWHFLSDHRTTVTPEQALAWGRQIGQVLSNLHNMSFSLGTERKSSLENILIITSDAYMADISTCIPFPQNAQQAHRTVLADIRFLSRLLYAIATGKNMTRDLQNLQIASLPRALQIVISMGAKGSYVSIDEMLAHLEGRNLPPLRFVSGKATHSGRERDHNEDQFFAYEVAKGRSNQPLPAFYMVADGMGGHEAGEVASETISQSLQEWLDEYSSRQSGSATRKLGENPEQALKTAIQHANQAVFHQAKARANNMGATVTAAMIIGSQAIVANVGDSRTYLYRQGKLERITNDHSLVFSLAKTGQIEWDEIYTHPQRNSIYRNLGAKMTVEVDTFTIDLASRDRLLLCSDGLWEMVRDPKIEQVLAAASNPQQACEQLVDLANHNGGEDNITVVVVRVI